MTNEQSAVLQHLRRMSHHGERSCRWCRREMMGDHAELLHLLCAPDADQLELFQSDQRRLEGAKRGADIFLLLSFAPFLIVVFGNGAEWVDVLLGTVLEVLLLVQRWYWREQLRLTRGMWRKARGWMKEAK